MRTSLAGSVEWTLLIVSRTRTSIPVHVSHPTVAHSSLTESYFLLLPLWLLIITHISSTGMSTKYFSSQSWPERGFFSVKKTSVRKNLIIFLSFFFRGYGTRCKRSHTAVRPNYGHSASNSYCQIFTISFNNVAIKLQ